MTAKSTVRGFADTVNKVAGAYSDNGYQLLGSYSPFIFPYSGIVGSYVEKDGIVQSTSGGLPIEEWSILYGIFEQLQPSGLLIVGNSYGVSALFALAANPEALVIAIDKFRTRGLEVTRQIAESIGGGLQCIEASTPDDLGALADLFEGQNKTLDFVFFDAVHEPEIIAKEYLALRESLSSGGVMVFHDCFTSGLVSAFRALKDSGNNDSFHLLSKSVTGLGCVVKDGLGLSNERLTSFLDFYSDSAETVHKLGELLSKNKSETAVAFFDDTTTSLTFPPHPQI